MKRYGIRDPTLALLKAKMTICFFKQIRIKVVV